ncbi:hypothetical protein [Bartonella sp. AC142YNZD]|uniref:hypothetical protein n=1 Tax=Bartonella sp. AC142YNZD TaxID=3243448 RepID=UPI0035CFB604
MKRIDLLRHFGHDLWFLLMKERGVWVVARDIFFKGLAFCCIFGLVLGFAYEDAGRPAIPWEVFWQGG